MFRIAGLDPAQFRPLFDLPDAELAARGILRKTVDDFPGYPCRVSLDDARVGEEVLLLHYAHHDVESPYRGSGPIYVRRAATQAAVCVDEVPPAMLHRLLSVRGYDRLGMLRECEVVQGKEAAPLFARWLADPEIAYLHVHNARPGCFSAAVVRG